MDTVPGSDGGRSFARGDLLRCIECNVLLPFAFHCTGMLIKASTDKLLREAELYGVSPPFPTEKEDSAVDVSHASTPEVSETAPDQFRSRRSKAASKSGGQKFQWEIVRVVGLSDKEIERFRDPRHWLVYFPPLAKEDLKAFGLGCDWRRSFITTDMNPFYDSCVTISTARRDVMLILNGHEHKKYNSISSTQSRTLSKRGGKNFRGAYLATT